MRGLTIPILAATLAATLAGLSTPGVANAKCASWNLRAVPKKGARAVPTNVKIFFGIYGYFRKSAVSALKGSYLKSGRHKVRLKIAVLPSSKLSMRMTYVLMTPARRLKPSRTYRLVLAAPPGPNNYQAKEMAAYNFTTGKGKDTKAPAAPQRVGTTGYRYRRLGCGPSENITITLPSLKDDRTPSKELRLRLDVVEKSAGQTRHLVIFDGPPWSPGHALLGHGMCSGNFHLKHGATYAIRVRAIDYAGNTSAPSKALTVTASRGGTP